MPELGAVYWSREAQQFYQEGRRGALSRLEALEHLRFQSTAYGERLMDERGQFVPGLYNLIPDALHNQYVNATRTGRLIGDTAYTDRASTDAYYMTLATYSDAEGHLHLIEKGFRGQSAIDRELETRKLVAQIGEELFPGQRGNSSTIVDMLREVFHYEVF